MPASAKSELLKLDRVVRSFDDGSVVAVRDVNLSIGEGDCVALVGRSGSGKTTLIQMMCGMDTPTSGTVAWKGRVVSDRKSWTAIRASEIGIVFQEFLLMPTLTALENVRIAIAADPTRDKALVALEKVGLAHRANHLPHKLSGGERQRVAIARGIVNEPQLLLVDEPTGSLDVRNAELVSDLLFDLQSRSSHALVLVTHDQALAQRCQAQITISDGQIVGGAE